MALSVWFWVLLVVAIVFDLWASRPADLRGWGHTLVLWILLVLLGLGVYGSPVRH